ncbi:MAG: rhodanese-like domain-containing protein [Chitinophagaceae bacterium]
MKNVFFLLLFFNFINCRAQGDPLSYGPEEFQQAIKGTGIQVLDVRTAAEFKNGHIKNALQADWNNQKQFNERVQYVDKDKPVYIYCLVGGRSAAAADWMRRNGFKTVTELRGGINAWKQGGLPLEGSPDEPQMTMEKYLDKISKDKPVLVDFGAPWCPPCVKMQPVLDSLEDTKGLKFKLVKIDAGLHTNLMKELAIGAIPVFIIYKEGKEVWRKEGVISFGEIKEQLK